MFDLSRLYRPVTSAPLGRSAYGEAMPAAPLRPYVRCFWRSLPSAASPMLVIPDTCMDLMFIRQPDGSLRPVFCALNDASFTSANDGRVSFAIRFYPWAAALFAQESLAGTLNEAYDGHWHFPTLIPPLLGMLEAVPDFAGRCACAQTVLMQNLQTENDTFLNAMHALLRSEGRMRTAAVAQTAQVSARQLERIFAKATGASPKKLASLIRYQNLWRDAATDAHFNVQDAVFRYGYTDQSHLLREFKAYHSLTLTEARALAQKEVAFLQFFSHSK